MNADPLARWYRWIEYAAFGGALERSRFAFLDRLSQARRILILGEGDGRALQRLLELNRRNDVEIHVVERSAEMIALARRRIVSAPQVRFLQQDAIASGTVWQAAHYDAAVTQFFLDCCSEAEARDVIGRVNEALTPGAIWLVTDFAVPEDRGRLARLHARVWLRAMYWFFGATTGLQTQKLPPMTRLLEEAGLQRTECQEDRAGLIRSEVWQRPADDLCRKFTFSQ